MKILHIMGDYKPSTGGSVVRNSNMIDAYLRNYTDSIFLINLAGDRYEEDEIIDGVKIHRCRCLRDMIFYAGNAIKEWDIDIIHTHNYRFMFVGYISRFLSCKKIPIVTELHALYRMKHYKEIIAHKLLKKSKGVIVLSESAKRYLSLQQGIDDSIITPVLNGLPQRQMPVRYQDNLYNNICDMKRKHIIIAYFGTFYEWQGVLFLSGHADDILGTFDNLYLLMCGDGPDFDKVERDMKRCRNQDRVLLMHNIEKERILKLYELVDIILIPRVKSLKTDTAIPLKAIEAMQFSKCILAGNDSGLQEILSPNNARLFESGNIESFLSVLGELVMDENLRCSLGIRAEKDVKEKVGTWDDNARSLHNVYERCMRLSSEIKKR